MLIKEIIGGLSNDLDRRLYISTRIYQTRHAHNYGQDVGSGFMDNYSGSHILPTQIFVAKAS
jgi:hypothetical protein